MAEGNPISRDTPIFDAVITPHRSLSPRGFRALMLLVAAIGLAVSLPFYLLGAWPVLGFMGIDIALIYLAFRYSNATARAYERLIVTRVQILFRAVSWRGRLQEMRFNPAWARIEREVHPEFGTEKLELVEARQRVELAASLGREERGQFADALIKAIHDARR